MDYGTLSNAALFDELRDLARRERRVTADFMACLAEAQRREKALIAQGFPSLFVFCVHDLKLAESTAYQRVKAARLARQRPETLAYLRSGEMSVKTLSMIAPHSDEHPDLVERIKGKSRTEVEAILASVTPARQIHDKIKLVPALKPDARPPELFDRPRSAPSSETAPEPPRRPIAQPELRAEISFAAGEPFLKALERLKALLWHQHPAGRLEDVILTAMTEYVKRHDPALDRQTAVCVPPADPRSRHVPAAVSRAVWQRDESRCTYVGSLGRCSETRGLEIDHVVPWALGGGSDDPANLRLLCAPHNQSERRRIFGESVPGHTPVDNS